MLDTLASADEDIVTDVDDDVTAAAPDAAVIEVDVANEDNDDVEVVVVVKVDPVEHVDRDVGVDVGGGG